MGATKARFGQGMTNTAVNSGRLERGFASIVTLRNRVP